VRVVHSLSLAAALLVLSLSASADPVGDAETLARLKQVLTSRYPGDGIQSVNVSPLPGMYEVFTTNGLAYSDARGDYLLVGQLYDTRTKTDLTTERLDVLNRIDFDKLPWDSAIKTVQGNGKRRVAVFSDPDCPYCKQLEQEIAGLKDVTIYTFLFPLTDLHPGAALKARAIWCASDRAEAWKAWMMEQKLPESAACTSDPVAKLQTLGKELRVASTPTLFLESGRRVSGTRSRAELESLLK
jgi:thiol:disulfide interchange protein DsbC